MSLILPGLYLGDYEDAVEIGRKCDIIINLNYPHNGIKWRKINIDDSQKPIIIKVGVNDSEYESMIKIYISLSKIINEYLKDGKKVIVHCKAGISRSASTIIAYLMIYKKMNLEDAYYYVLKRREIIEPNDGFIKQLKQLEKIIKS